MWHEKGDDLVSIRRRMVHAQSPRLFQRRERPRCSLPSMEVRQIESAMAHLMGHTAAHFCTDVERAIEMAVRLWCCSGDGVLMTESSQLQLGSVLHDVPVMVCPKLGEKELFSADDLQKCYHDLRHPHAPLLKLVYIDYSSVSRRDRNEVEAIIHMAHAYGMRVHLDMSCCSSSTLDEKWFRMFDSITAPVFGDSDLPYGTVLVYPAEWNETIEMMG